MQINLTQATAMLCACLMVTAWNRDEPGCTDPTALNYDQMARLAILPVSGHSIRCVED